ncbi:MAG: 16S rRNA (adenine(1518)-N(6)/adenine(1519)-N(6))-dimethyltransferase RsmA [Candidatus Wallbacteria bacterium]|nr:16S rRNA (adenine(1518)-N(6)/adenine(1519)-N(6))-dimethyltransferase RsmA [Candidatus Wallbacteria bacterium]
MKKSELMSTLERLAIRPSRSKGQNFLWQDAIFERISKIVPDAATVIEIGTGPGGLTETLANRFSRVIGYEIDEGLYRISVERLSALENVTLIQADFLEADLSEFCGSDLSVVGNLPFSIASQIIFKLIPYQFPMVFMLQKEVGDRLQALVGSKNYSFFTALTGYYYEVKKLFPVGPENFYPAPKVSSLLLSFTPRRRDPKDFDSFREFVKKAFSCRRKMLCNNYSEEERGRVEKSLTELGISLKSRAQELKPEQLYKLFELAKEQFVGLYPIS